MLSAHVPDLDALELLLTIGRTGSLGAAARERNVSQPAVTARVQTLERLTGLTLVQRTPRGSTLSAAGGLLADWAREVVAAAETLDAGVAALRHGHDARLQLAASLTVAEHLLPTWLVLLAAERPTTTASLSAVNSAETARLVLAGKADLGFLEGPVIPAGLSSRVVAKDRLVVVVPPGHPWARLPGGVSSNQLARTRLVQREPDSGTRASFERAMRAAGPLAAPMLELSTAAAVRAAAIAGAGPAVLSSLAVAADLSAHRLISVPVQDVNLSRSLRAVWPRGARPSGPARDLLAIALRNPPSR